MIFMKETSELLYIGQTKDNPESRLEQHLSPRQCVRRYLDAQGYRRNQMRDLLELLEVFFTQDRIQALAQEKLLIQLHHPTINTVHNSQPHLPSPVLSLSQQE